MEERCETLVLWVEEFVGDVCWFKIKSWKHPNPKKNSAHERHTQNPSMLQSSSCAITFAPIVRLSKAEGEEGRIFA